MNNVNNISPNILLTEEAALFVLLDWTWKTDQLEAQLKSPFPFLPFDYVNPEVLDPLP
jgi:hypothetical protein